MTDWPFHLSKQKQGQRHLLWHNYASHWCWPVIYFIIFEKLAAERGVVTLSVGRRSGVRLWLARVMHSSKVLMNVAQVALSREACRRNRLRCCWGAFKDPNVPLSRGNGRRATSTVGAASVSAEYCVWMVWTCWTRRSQYSRSSDIFVFRPSGPADRHKSVRFTLLEIPKKCWLLFLGILKISVPLGVSNHVNSVQTAYPCVCDCPVFQLWRNPAPPTTSVSRQRSQLGRKSAARRGWSAPDASGRSGGL